MNKKEFYRNKNKELVVTPRMHEIINEIYKYMYGETVLDIGCGNRIITSFMSLHNKVTGIDIEEDIYKYKTDIKFSSICLFDVLEHLERRRDVIEIINKLLLQNGKLWINQPEQEDQSQPYDRFVDFELLISLLRKQNYRLLYQKWYAIGKNESYNFMIFRKL